MAVKNNVTMSNQLPGLSPGVGKSQPVYDVIQAPFQQHLQRFAGNTRLFFGFFEHLPELTFQDTIQPACFLFFAQL